MTAAGSSPDPTATLLMANECALLDPAFRRDRAHVSALLADDFVEFSSSGRVWTRDAILDLLATEDYTPPHVEDLTCRHIADGVALVLYKTIRTDAATGARSVTLRSSLWSKESDGWRIRFHQGTPAV
jgi:hypothetical protein